MVYSPLCEENCYYWFDNGPIKKCMYCKEIIDPKKLYEKTGKIIKHCTNYNKIIKEEIPSASAYMSKKE